MDETNVHGADNMLQIMEKSLDDVSFLLSMVMSHDFNHSSPWIYLLTSNFLGDEFHRIHLKGPHDSAESAERFSAHLAKGSRAFCRSHFSTGPCGITLCPQLG